MRGPMWAPYLDYPNVVHIETLTKCNAACGFCPSPTLERSGNRMPDALIDKILGDLEAIPLPFYVSPFKVNEPFLDNRLLDICQDINRRLPRAMLRLFSNGSPITRRKLEGIAQLKRVEHLWVSLNDHREAEYEQVMHLPYQRTISRLDAIHEARLPFPVVVSRVCDNTEADDAFADWVERRWPRFRVHLIERADWLGDNPGPSVPAVVPDRGCVRWFEVDITSTGVVALCCMDGRARYPVGDVSKQAVLEVYNSPGYRHRRASRLSRRVHQPCDRCTY